MTGDGTPCDRCHQHPASRVRAASVMDYSHGHFSSWCACCVLHDLIRRAREAVARVPEWERELTAACGGELAPDPQALIEDNAKLRAEGYHQWLAAHYQLCGKRYGGDHASNYAAPHPEGEWCYWPEPAVYDHEPG